MAITGFLLDLGRGLAVRGVSTGDGLVLSGVFDPLTGFDLFAGVPWPWLGAVLVIVSMAAGASRGLLPLLAPVASTPGVSGAGHTGSGAGLTLATWDAALERRRELGGSLSTSFRLSKGVAGLEARAGSSD